MNTSHSKNSLRLLWFDTLEDQEEKAGELRRGFSLTNRKKRVYTVRMRTLRSPGSILWGIILVSIACGHVNAEEWMRTYGGGEGRCVQQTRDGGYVVTGQSRAVSPHALCLVRTDSLGDTLWTRIFVDTVETMGCYVEQTSDGGYIVAGEYGSPNGRGYLMKVNPLGDLQWRQIHYFAGCFSCVVQACDGGYVATGNMESSFTRIGVTKTDSLGDTLWTRMPPGAAGAGHWITELADSTLAVVGDYYGGWETWPVSLIKMDRTGDILWIVDYDTLGYGGRNHWPGRAARTSDGGYVIIGQRFMVKTDSVGAIIWEKPMEIPECVKPVSSGGYVLLGPYGLTLTKLNPSGDSVWTREVLPPGSNSGYYVQQTVDSGYVVTGTKYEGAWRIVLIKMHGSVGVERKRQLNARTLERLRVIPNPVVSSALISYYVGSTGNTEIGIHDISGRLIEVIAREEMAEGIHNVIWDTRNVPPGVYFCVLRQARAVNSRKITVLRR
jgi:hypothetical protein